MGTDFSALLRYDGMSEQTLSAISQLESRPGHTSIDAVVQLGLEEDFAFARHCNRLSNWYSWSDWETPLPTRPSLPGTQVYLDLPSDFQLTFGHDAIWLYHPLRWLFFRRDEQWQRVMLNAVGYFADLFQARDCIITGDCNPAILEFQKGASFATAIAVAESKGEGCVPRLDDLYADQGFADDLAFVDWDGQESAIPIWDSHGFWRFPCGR